jgi:tripartite-type tricarboxylate transporter receptor subunit TctC
VIVPDLPTLHEAGVPGYDVSIAYGVLAPAQSPKAVVAKLHQEITRILALPDIRDRLLDLGAEPVDSSPEQFAQHIRKEIAKWAAVVKTTGMETQTW